MATSNKKSSHPLPSYNRTHSNAPCRVVRQATLRKDRSARKESIFGSLDKLLGAASLEAEEEERSCDIDIDYYGEGDTNNILMMKRNETFRVKDLNSESTGVFELQSTPKGRRKVFVQKEESNSRISSSGSLGKLAEKAKALSKRAKDSLSSSQHDNSRDRSLSSSTRRASKENDESRLDRKKRLFLGFETTASSRRTSASSSFSKKDSCRSNYGGSKSSKSSKSSKLFKSSEAETLAMLIAQELDDLDC